MARSRPDRLPVRHEVAETRDLDEDTLLDLDASGRVCAITVEHASRSANAPSFSYARFPA